MQLYFLFYIIKKILDKRARSKIDILAKNEHFITFITYIQ